jgi:hypothetical protein
MTENIPTIQPDIIQSASEMVIPLNKEERDAAFYKELDAIRNQPEGQPLTETQSETQSETKVEQATERDPIAESQTEAPIETSPDDDELSNKSIPKKRLDKEISKRQELEFKLQEEREARIKYETELRVFNDALHKLNVQQAKEPELDPIDNDAHNFYMKKIQELEKKIEDKTTVLETNNLQNRFESTVNNQATEFTKKHSDFQNAYQYVIDKEKQNARLFGVPENQLDTFVAEKLQPVALHVYNNGGNVAETVYNMAKNYGYNATKAANSNVNLKAIEKNMAKSQSIIDDVPASSISIKNNSSTRAATELSTYQEIMQKAGPDKEKIFYKLLNDIKNG